MPATPESRDTAPISLVDGMENISSLFFGETKSEMLGLSGGPGESGLDIEVCLSEYS